MRFPKDLFPVLLLTIVAIHANTRVHAGIVAYSGFDGNLEGWTSNTPSEVSWKMTGGNPGGYAQFVDGSSGESFFLAPSSFLGDLRILDGSGTLSYDLRLVQLGGFNSGMVPHEVRLIGPGGQANWIGEIPTEGLNWNHLIIPVQENSWNVVSGSWDQLLANVTSLRIRAEHFNNFLGQPNRETFTIDNVTLTANPVPEPSALVSFMIAGAVGAAFRMRRRRLFGVSRARPLGE
jgi:hypothetical protein